MKYNIKNVEILDNEILRITIDDENKVDIKLSEILDREYEPHCPICGGTLIWMNDYDYYDEDDPEYVTSSRVYSTWLCEYCHRTIEVIDPEPDFDSSEWILLNKKCDENTHTIIE